MHATTITLFDGRTLPRAGIGTWAAGGTVYWGDTPTLYGEVDDARSEAALAMAYEMGCRIFDTAPAYDDVRGGDAEWLRFFQRGEPNADILVRLDAIRDLLRSEGRTPAQGALGWILAASPIARRCPASPRKSRSPTTSARSTRGRCRPRRWPKSRPSSAPGNRPLTTPLRFGFTAIG